MRLCFMSSYTRCPFVMSSHVHGTRTTTLLDILTCLLTVRDSVPPPCRERKDTCAVAALSLTLRQRKQHVLWRFSGLPSACHAVVAVPGRPAGLIVSQSHIMYIAQQVGSVFVWEGRVEGGLNHPNRYPASTYIQFWR